MDDENFQPAHVHAKRRRLSGVAEPSLIQHEREEEAAISASMVFDDIETSKTIETENKENIQAPEGQTSKRDKGKGKEADFIPVHGNYRGYYAKRRPGNNPYSRDERLALMSKEWLQDKRVLDIGCNAGKVTIEIAQRFGPYRVTGVDIDSELIKQAHKGSRIAWSAQSPLPTVQQAAKTERERDSRWRRAPSKEPEPIEASEAVVPTPNYFPSALSRMYGYLLQLPTDRYLRQYVKPSEEESKERSQRRDGKRSRGSVMPKKVCLFPHNISFKKADWVNEEIPSDKRGYDCILALSVVKWIHLNGGDEGLKEFFTRVFMTLHPNGRFILEPQPWESYQKAVRLSDSLKESYGNLKIRPTDFEKILLEEIGFQSVEKLTDESGKGFVRPLHVYKKIGGSWL